MYRHTRMFKSRSGSQGHAPTPAAPSIDELRRRARHRLIGAAVLVALGVVGFPLLFDTAPRPLTADVPIDIPSRGVSSLPARKPAAAADVTSSAGPSAPVPVAEALDPREERDHQGRRQERHQALCRDFGKSGHRQRRGQGAEAAFDC